MKGSVVEYRGKRGTVWRIKYRDATGKQVMETVGAENDGITRKTAEAELRERLVRVERKQYRKPKAITFAVYQADWFEGARRRRDWRPSTVRSRRLQLARLGEFFGPLLLGSVKPHHVSDYIAMRLEGEQALAPATVVGDVEVLHDVFKTAVREGLVDANPAEGAERPKIPRRRWRILEPIEVARTLKAFRDEQARTAFLTLIVTGIRRGELQGLRWRDVDLLENVLRVRRSKTEEGERSIAIGPTLAEALWQWRRQTAFQGEDERVFCNQATGGEYREERFAEQLRMALRAAKVEGHVRPFHDLRHASLTNGAAAGETPIALMTRAGHSNMGTTKRYLHLAGVVFRDEAEALERRLLGAAAVSTTPSTNLSAPERTED
jgi:integrase